MRKPIFYVGLLVIASGERRKSAKSRGGGKAHCIVPTDLIKQSPPQILTTIWVVYDSR